MLCPKCKKELEKGSWFCPYCGEMIDTSTSESTKEETLASTATTATSTVPTQELPQVGVLPEGPVVAPLASTLSPEEHKKQTKNCVRLVLAVPWIGLGFYTWVFLFFMDDLWNNIIVGMYYRIVGLFQGWDTVSAFTCLLYMALMAILVWSLVDCIRLTVKTMKEYSKFDENYQKELEGTATTEGKEESVWVRLVQNAGGAVFEFLPAMFFVLNVGNLTEDYFGMIFSALIWLSMCIIMIIYARKIKKLFKRRVSQ